METTFDLVWQHYPYLRNVARQWCGDYSTADDVVQETMLKAWRGLPNFRAESNLKTWLFRIARNCFLSMFERKEKVVCVENLPEYSGNATQLRDLCFDETVERLASILEGLNTQDKSIFALKMEGCSNGEISTELNIKRERINVRIFRMRKKINRGNL